MIPPALALLLNLAIMGIGLAAALYAVSAFYLRAIQVHDLTVRAHALRNQYAQRLESLRYGITEADLIAPGLDHRFEAAAEDAPSGSDTNPALVNAA